MESMGSWGGAGRDFKIERMGCSPKRRCCLSAEVLPECGVLAREGDCVGSHKEGQYGWSRWVQGEVRGEISRLSGWVACLRGGAA